MKSKKRIFTMILALAIALGGVVVPSFGINSVLASTDAIAESNATLTVNYNEANKIYNVTNNNVLTFKDFVGNALTTNDIYATLWAPDGTECFNGVVGEETTYSFTEPGLYALGFKLADASSTIYSRQYYVAVENSLDEILLTETLSQTAKTGSFVRIPNCSTENVNVLVYTSYGENVPINDNKFTNKANVIGTYYIEYSKEVEDLDVTMYKYLTITFGDNYGEPQTTEIVDSTTEEFKFGQSIASAIKSEVLYLFKEYDFTDVEIVKGEDVLVGQDDIKVSLKQIDNAGVVEYYDFDGMEFGSTVIEPETLDELRYAAPFMINSFEGFSGADKNGNKYELTYTSEEYGLEKTITLVSKFDVSAFRLELDSLMPDIILVDAENAENNSYTLPGATISIADGYVRDYYTDLLSEDGIQISVSFKDKDGNKIEFSSETEADYKIEIVDSGSKVKLSAPKISYDKLREIAKENNFSYSVTIKYYIDYSSSENTAISGTINPSQDYAVKFATKTNDDRKPTDLKIEDFAKILYTRNDHERFTLPNATAVDVDNAGAKTNGVIINISYRNADGTVIPTSKKPGDVVQLEHGSYVFTYTFTDSAGNSRTKDIMLKVCAEQSYDIDINEDFANVSASYTKLEENKYQFNIANSKVMTALVYTEDEIAKSPSSVTYSNGFMSSVIVESDKDFVLVMSARSMNQDRYISYSIVNNNSVNKIRPYGYNQSDKSITYVAEDYALLSVCVGDRVLWLKSNDFVVETDGGIYIVENGNEIVIQYPGTYIVKDKATGVATTITASESKIKNAKDFLSMKKVVSSKLTSEADRTINIQAPYIEGYFGYSLATIVTTSDGLEIPVEDGKFVVNKTDCYKVTHTYNYLTTTKEIIEYVSSGSIIKPTIAIPENYQNIEWSGESSRVYVINASAIDKQGKTISNIVVNVYDKFGQELEVKVDESGKSYFEVVDAGIYSVYYTAVDEDGFSSTKQVGFMVLYAEEDGQNGLSGWAIAGIVIGSVVGAGLIAFLIVFIIKAKKNKVKFINKSRQAKKESKLNETKSDEVAFYTIAQSKNESEWTIKKGNRVFAKASTKEEAIAKIDEEKDAQKKIKVYNKQGRLIDSIE